MDMKKSVYVIAAILILGWSFFRPDHCGTEQTVNKYVEMINDSINGKGVNFSSHCITQVVDDAPEYIYTWLKLDGGHIGFKSGANIFVFSNMQFSGASKSLEKSLYSQTISLNNTELSNLLKMPPPNK